ncbi:hypothetical protein ACE1AT_16285 [Pelatocladus sp. BLCC-F211]|uniref:hypothetical protein n=1 Tax=Pelatocladus sp. BLCC-F211 TaxID=3342752 RepID=UPI0035BA2E84
MKSYGSPAEYNFNIVMETEESTLATLEEITFADFLKVDIRVGQIIEVTDNLKAKQPAYVLTIDFGELGHKTSSAQVTQNYTKEELLRKMYGHLSLVRV